MVFVARLGQGLWSCNVSILSLRKMPNVTLVLFSDGVCIRPAVINFPFNVIVSAHVQGVPKNGYPILFLG